MSIINTAQRITPGTRREFFSLIRQAIRDIRGFGDEEANVLKKQLEEHKQELEQLKLLREKRREQEEAIMLLELRRAVGSLKQVEDTIKQQEIVLVKTAEGLERQMKSEMESDMNQRAVDILANIDYSKILGTGDVSESIEKEIKDASDAVDAGKMTAKKKPTKGKRGPYR